jgi:hypothetical protein
MLCGYPEQILDNPGMLGSCRLDLLFQHCLEDDWR